MPLKVMNKGALCLDCSPNLDCHEFSTTGNELPGGFHLDREVRKSESVPVDESPVIRSQEDPVSSPVKSFQLQYSSQSSEEGSKRGKDDSLYLSFKGDQGSAI